jgi:hypothetical protein
VFVGICWIFPLQVLNSQLKTDMVIQEVPASQLVLQGGDEPVLEFVRVKARIGIAREPFFEPYLAVRASDRPLLRQSLALKVVCAHELAQPARRLLCGANADMERDPEVLVQLLHGIMTPVLVGAGLQLVPGEVHETPETLHADHHVWVNELDASRRRREGCADGLAHACDFFNVPARFEVWPKGVFLLHRDFED